MHDFQHKLTGVAIVFGLSFCIVATAKAESVEITNTVYSYSNSGGHGQDGRSGEDGAPGEDGRSGSDGETVISGSGSASVRVETYIDGERVLKLETTNATSSKTTDMTTETDAPSRELSADERSRLMSLLEKIRLILMNYVFEIL